MTDQSIFHDDWRVCLREHYMYVVHENDTRTLHSLAELMHEMGFDESELAELRVRATMHIDQVPADFVPDLEALAPEVDEDDENAGYVQLTLF